MSPRPGRTSDSLARRLTIRGARVARRRAATLRAARAPFALAAVLYALGYGISFLSHASLERRVTLEVAAGEIAAALAIATIIAVAISRYVRRARERVRERARSIERLAARAASGEAELRRLKTQVVDQALYDELTGLASRALLHDRVTHALQRSARDGGGTMAVLFLELDDVRGVRESLGAAAGDRLLALVAGRLRAAPRACDTVARLGGDTFAILAEGVRADDQAMVVANRVLAALREPFALPEREVRVRAAIGVARAQPGEATHQLLRNADVALYHARQTGQGSIAAYSSGMHIGVLDRLELEGDLRAALAWQGDDEGELHMMYQPLVDLSTRAVTGYEALARWAHPRRGAVPPSAFIPVAEESGLIAPLGRWTLRTACREATRWAGAPDVSVNLSGHQLRDPRLVDDVRAALAESGLPPARLTLEVSERAIMRDVEHALSTLSALKALGVHLAIDDFGAGYTTLTDLQRFPVDALKIDTAYVHGVARGGSDTALARAVIALGLTLRLRTVAEGIEDAEQERALRAMGCDLAQGHHFAHPMRPEAIERVHSAAGSHRR